MEQLGGSGDAPLRVLVVEDEELEAKALARSLRRWSTSVVIANDGIAALRELGAGEFDLVIADVNVPGASGLEVLDAARKKSRDSYRAALTATFEKNVVHGVELLDALYICKPAPMDMLEKAIAGAEELRARRAGLTSFVEWKATGWNLSNRQREILQWLVKHGTSADWSGTFDITAHTFREHVKDIRARVQGNPYIDDLVRMLLLEFSEGTTRAR